MKNMQVSEARQLDVEQAIANASNENHIFYLYFRNILSWLEDDSVSLKEKFLLLSIEDKENHTLHDRIANQKKDYLDSYLRAVNKVLSANLFLNVDTKNLGDITIVIDFLKRHFDEAHLSFEDKLALLSQKDVDGYSLGDRILEMNDTELIRQYSELLKICLNGLTHTAETRKDFLQQIYPHTLGNYFKKVRTNSPKEVSKVLNGIQVFLNVMGYTAKEKLDFLSLRDGEGRTLGHRIAYHQDAELAKAYLEFIKDCFKDEKLPAKEKLDFLSLRDEVGWALEHYWIASNQDAELTKTYLELIKDCFNDEKLTAKEKLDFLSFLSLKTSDGWTLGHRIARQDAASTKAYLELIKDCFKDENLTAKEKLDFLSLKDSAGWTLGHRIARYQDAASTKAYLELIKDCFKDEKLTTKEKLYLLNFNGGACWALGRVIARYQDADTLQLWKSLLLGAGISLLTTAPNKQVFSSFLSDNGLTAQDLTMACQKQWQENPFDLHVKLFIARLIEFGYVAIKDVPDVFKNAPPHARNNPYEQAAFIYRNIRGSDSTFVSTYHLAILILENKIQTEIEDNSGESFASTREELAITMLSSIPKASPIYSAAQEKLTAIKKPMTNSSTWFKLSQLIPSSSNNLRYPVEDCIRLAQEQRERENYSNAARYLRAVIKDNRDARVLMILADLIQQKKVVALPTDFFPAMPHSDSMRCDGQTALLYREVISRKNAPVERYRAMKALILLIEQPEGVKCEKNDVQQAKELARTYSEKLAPVDCLEKIKQFVVKAENLSIPATASANLYPPPLPLSNLQKEIKDQLRKEEEQARRIFSSRLPDVPYSTTDQQFFNSRNNNSNTNENDIPLQDFSEKDENSKKKETSCVPAA